MTSQYHNIIKSHPQGCRRRVMYLFGDQSVSGCHFTLAHPFFYCYYYYYLMLQQKVGNYKTTSDRLDQIDLMKTNKYQKERYTSSQKRVVGDCWTWGLEGEGIPLRFSVLVRDSWWFFATGNIRPIARLNDSKGNSGRRKGGPIKRRTPATPNGQWNDNIWSYFPWGTDFLIAQLVASLVHNMSILRSIPVIFFIFLFIRYSSWC